MDCVHASTFRIFKFFYPSKLLVSMYTFPSLLDDDSNIKSAGNL